MTGEDLYNLYRDSQWEVSLWHPPLWEDLSEEDQEVWDATAAKLAE